MEEKIKANLPATTKQLVTILNPAGGSKTINQFAYRMQQRGEIINASAPGVAPVWHLAQPKGTSYMPQPPTLLSSKGLSYTPLSPASKRGKTCFVVTNGVNGCYDGKTGGPVKEMMEKIDSFAHVYLTASPEPFFRHDNIRVSIGNYLERSVIVTQITWDFKTWIDRGATRFIFITNGDFLDHLMTLAKTQDFDVWKAKSWKEVTHIVNTQIVPHF